MERFFDQRILKALEDQNWNPTRKEAQGVRNFANSQFCQANPEVGAIIGNLACSVDRSSLVGIKSLSFDSRAPLLYFALSILADLRKEIPVCHSLQWILGKDRNCCAFIDIDSDERDITDEYLDEILTAFEKLVSETFEDIPSNGFRELMMYNSKNSMRKVHVHYPNLPMKKVVLEKLWEQLRKAFPEVDSKAKGIRVVNCCKTRKYEKDGQTLTALDRTSIYKTSGILKEQLNQFFDACPLLGKDQTPLNLRANIQCHFETPAYPILILKGREVNTAIPDSISELIDMTQFKLGVFENRSARLTRIKAGYCSICKRNHQNDNAALNFREGFWSLYCFRAGKSMVLAQDESFISNKDRIKQLQRRVSLSEEETEELQARIDYKNDLKDFHDQRASSDLMSRMNPLPSSRYKIIEVNQPQLEDFSNLMNSETALMVSSPMGTGKTHQLIKFIQENPLEKVLFINFRRSLSIELEQKLHGLKFTNYQDIKGPIFSNRLIIQVESLNRIRLSEFDLVVIDEATSVLSQFDSGLHAHNLKKNQLVFEELLKTARNLVLLDAFHDTRTIDFLSQVLSKKIVWLKNIYKADNRTYNRIATPDLVLKKILDYAKTGKRVIVPTSSKSFGERVQLALNEANISNFFFSTDRGDSHKYLSDINKSAASRQVFIYSPTIEAGCDIQVPFDHMVALASNLANSFRSFYQMLGRARNLISKIVDIGFQVSSANPKSHPYDRDLIRTQLTAFSDGLTKLVSDKMRSVHSGNTGFQMTVKTQTGRLVTHLESDPWLDLTVENIREAHLSAMHEEALFQTLVESCGGQFTSEEVNSSDTELLKQLQKEAKQQRKTLKYNRAATFDNANVSELTPDSSHTEEVLANKKEHLAKHFKKDFNLSGEWFVAWENSFSNLFNARMERDSTPDDIVLELLATKAKVSDSKLRQFALFHLIDLVKKPLGFEQSWKGSFTSHQVKALYPILKPNQRLIQGLFGSRKDLKDSTQSILPVLIKLFSNWSGVEIKTSKPNHGPVKYTLKHPLDIAKSLGGLKSREPGPKLTPVEKSINPTHFRKLVSQNADPNLINKFIQDPKSI